MLLSASNGVVAREEHPKGFTLYKFPNTLQSLRERNQFFPGASLVKCCPEKPFPKPDVVVDGIWPGLTSLPPQKSLFIHLASKGKLTASKKQNISLKFNIERGGVSRFYLFDLAGNFHSCWEVGAVSFVVQNILFAHLVFSLLEFPIK